MGQEQDMALRRFLELAMSKMLTSIEEQADSITNAHQGLQLPSPDAVSYASGILSVLACRGDADDEAEVTPGLANGQGKG